MLRTFIVQEFLGKFPTIFLSFKHDETYNQPKMKEILQQLYQQNEFLLSSFRLDRNDKKKFCAYLNYQAGVPMYKEAKFTEAIPVLCDLLHKHYEKKVYVFIDNYDTPILDALSNNRPMYNYLPFLETMLSRISSCKSLNRLVMSGTTSISRFETIKVTEFKFLTTNKYTKYFGFTERDLQEMAVRCSAEVMEDLKKGCYYTASKTKIYSPEWVLSRLNYSPIENPYWHENVMKKQIYYLPVMKTKIRLLLLGDHIKFVTKKYRTTKDLWLINKLMNATPDDELEESEINLIFSVFAEFGLFTFAPHRRPTAHISLPCTNNEPKNKLLLNETSRGSRVLKTLFSS